MKDNTIDVVVGILSQYDEMTFIPLLASINDVALSFYEKKYGSEFTVSEFISFWNSIREIQGNYIMDNREFESIQSVNVSIVKKELPFS